MNMEKWLPAGCVDRHNEASYGDDLWLWGSGKHREHSTDTGLGVSLLTHTTARRSVRERPLPVHVHTMEGIIQLHCQPQLVAERTHTQTNWSTHTRHTQHKYGHTCACTNTLSHTCIRHHT